MATVVRTSVLGLFFGALVAIGIWQLLINERHRNLRELEALNEQMAQRLAVKAEMIERLGRTRRIAHVRILDQQTDADGEITETKLLFIELDEDGTELARQTVTLPGDTPYVDVWTVKFDPERVAEGHPLFGRTILLLRRIYSDRMAPIDGVAIDTPGAVPPAYAVSEAGRFQQQLWEHFWQIATDARMAEAMGVRVAQGEAVYKRVRTGDVFELIADAVGGINLRPLPKDDLASLPDDG